MLIDQSCREFSNNLSSKAPVPGGGGVAAMLGALGTALCQMAGNLTVGKKKYAEFDDDNRRIIDEAEKIRLRFLELVDEDAAVYWLDKSERSTKLAIMCILSGCDVEESKTLLEKNNGYLKSALNSIKSV